MGVDVNARPHQAIRHDNTYYIASKLGEYKPLAPHVAAVKPHWDSTSGGALVSVMGRNFGDLSSVTINGVSCQFRLDPLLYEKHERLEVRVPASKKDSKQRPVTGDFDVVVTGRVAGQGTCRQRFTYVTAADSNAYRRSGESPEPKYNDDVLAKETHQRCKYVPLRAVLQTIQNEDGLIINSEFIPSDCIQSALVRLTDMWREQRKRTDKLMTECFYTDNVQKYKKR